MAVPSISKAAWVLLDTDQVLPKGKLRSAVGPTAKPENTPAAAFHDASFPGSVDEIAASSQ